jgi:hypothetical protein
MRGACVVAVTVTAAIALLPLFVLGPAFVANMFWYLDLWGLSWTWLLPRAFELIGIRDLYYHRKCDCLESTMVSRNVQLCGVH